MRETDVIEWLHDQLVTVLQNTSTVSLQTPPNHVGFAEDRDNLRYPTVAYQAISSSEHTAGVGNNQLTVDSVTYDTNDVAQSIERKRRVTLRVNVFVVTDGDRKVKSHLEDDVLERLLTLAETDDIPSDMESLNVEESTPQGRPDEFVYTDGMPVEVEYERFITDDDVTAAEEVNVDIDVDGGDGNTTDAFDETF